MTDIVKQVPFVQMSDLNDGDILNATRKMSDGNGGVVLAYTLPDGTDFQSTPMQASGEEMGKMMLQWVDVVKQRLLQVHSDAEEKAIEASGAKDKRFAGPSLSDFLPEGPVTETALAEAGVRIPPAAPPRKEDYVAAKYVEPRTAKEHVNAMIAEQTHLINHLRMDIKSRQTALVKAEIELSRWRAAKAAFGTVPSRAKRRRRGR